MLYFRGRKAYQVSARQPVYRKPSPGSVCCLCEAEGRGLVDAEVVDAYAGAVCSACADEVSQERCCAGSR